MLNIQQRAHVRFGENVQRLSEAEHLESMKRSILFIENCHWRMGFSGRSCGTGCWRQWRCQDCAASTDVLAELQSGGAVPQDCAAQPLATCGGSLLSVSHPLCLGSLGALHQKFINTFSWRRAAACSLLANAWERSIIAQPRSKRAKTYSAFTINGKIVAEQSAGSTAGAWS